MLALEARALSRTQRAFYFRNGSFCLESTIPEEWLCRLRAAVNRLVERSRRLTRSDGVFELAPGHSADRPRLRRVSSPVEQVSTFWEYAPQSVVGDIVADLVSPDVKFHHSKINFKWPGEVAEVKWHQDIQYSPHTNYSPLMVGTYLYDVGPDQGPLQAIPGSHEGELFDECDERRVWVGCLSEKDVSRLTLDEAVSLAGPAGSLTINNCRTIHGSSPSWTADWHPLLLNTFSSADAFPYTANPLWTRYHQVIIRG